MPDSWEERTSMFCGYLIKQTNIQSSTIKSYVSAIKSKLKADDYPWKDELVLLSTFAGWCQTCWCQTILYRSVLRLE